MEVQVLSSAPIKSTSYRDSDALHRRAFSLRVCGKCASLAQFAHSEAVDAYAIAEVAERDRTRNLESQIEVALSIGQDLVTHVGIALQPTAIHACEHRDVGINVVVHLDNLLSVVKPVQAADILLERPFP